jgi:glycosyltransferase involved in cell wall biosynthesis
MQVDEALSLSRVYARNVTASLNNKKYSRVFYVTENKDWVIKRVGRYISGSLSEKRMIDMESTVLSRGIYRQIVHFGSANVLFRGNKFIRPHPSNRVVLTWFHVVPDDPKNNALVKNAGSFDYFHTACDITRTKLTEMGMPENRLIKIPLGVDCRLFRPVREEEKSGLRKRYGIPENRIVVGSFQKDGAGWGDGLSPKLIKGPDLLVKTLEKINRSADIFVLLLGPSRGYVKKGLEKAGIDYKHVYLDDFLGVAPYYNMLDLYLVTSRVEGGPKAILESMAAGIPIISSRVGMAPEVIKNGVNGFLADVEDVDSMAEYALKVSAERSVYDRLSRNGIETVKEFTWDKIARRYYREIYYRLMDN